MQLIVIYYVLDGAIEWSTRWPSQEYASQTSDQGESAESGCSVTR